MKIKYLRIGFCDGCPYHRMTDGYNFCENAKQEIDKLGRFILIPDWCPLEDAPNQPLDSDTKSSGN